MTGMQTDVPSSPPERTSAQSSFSTGSNADKEMALAAVLAEIMHRDQVAVDSDFFRDLGADSLVMAHFCARVRKRSDLPQVSMRDVYAHSTVRDLALAVEAATPPRVRFSSRGSRGVQRGNGCSVGSHGGMSCAARCSCSPFSSTRAVSRSPVSGGYEWISAGSGFLDVYLRSVAFGGIAFVGLCATPVLVKWLLIGRWKPRRIRIWSAAYFRLWVVKTLVRSNPLVLFAGSPALHALPQGAGRPDRGGRCRGLLTPCAALYRLAVPR